jgi:hypothetical protein
VLRTALASTAAVVAACPTAANCCAASGACFITKGFKNFSFFSSGAFYSEKVSKFFIEILILSFGFTNFGFSNFN